MDAIITVDQNFRIIAFNPAAEKIFGMSADAALHQPIDIFVPSRFRTLHQRHVERFARTGISHRRMGALGALSALRANGDEFPIEASISQTTVEGERISTVILRDISERRANQEALLLAREVDHRAKNILSIVSSLIALTPATTVEDYKESLSGRVAAMSRANALLAANRWKGASLALLVRDELDAHGAAGRIDASGPDFLLATRAAQPISMLLHELATNALKYGALSLPAGRIGLRWSQQADGAIHLIWTERGGPPVHAPQETGFGMTLLQQIVDVQLAGSHAIDWNPAGMRFEALLPTDVLQIAPSEKQPAEPGQDIPASPHEPRSPDNDQGVGTLLIVEDEPLLAMQMSRSLERFGWTILGVAGSIESAKQMLARLPRPDAAILDVDLGGTSVFPLARALRRSGIPFIFCTGYEDLEYSSEFLGCITVRKPATALQIVQALREVVRHTSAQTSGGAPH